ncbi:MAG: transglutaminase family protein, partial [Cyanobacteria bacterium J06648_11]
MSAVSDEYLQADEVINWQHPQVLAQARSLAAGRSGVEAIAKACFEWVRDEVKHSSDYQLNPVTCSASEVLEHRTGYCYAKSHLPVSTRLKLHSCLRFGFGFWVELRLQ